MSTLPSSSTTTAVPMDNKQAAAGTSVKRKSPNSVVDMNKVIEILDSDDDDDDLPANAAASLPAKRQKTEATLASYHAKDIGAKTLFPAAAAAAKQPSPASDDDCVMLAEAPQQQMTLCPEQATTASSTGNLKRGDDDDIELVGCKNQCRFPHLRQHCIDKPFAPASPYFVNGFLVCMTSPSPSLQGGKNVEMCDLCYCYICDKPAKDCQRWTSPTNFIMTHNHCHASEKGPNAHIWSKLRELFKQHNGDVTRVDQAVQKEQSTAAAASVVRQPQVAENYRALQSMIAQLRRAPVAASRPRNRGSAPRRRAPATASAHLKAAPAPPKATILPVYLHKGCFEETNQSVSPYLHLLTKCRKCGWYSYTGSMRRDPASLYLAEGSAEEWCQACGRIARDDFIISKNQCEPYNPKATDVFLGSKKIPFSIKAHDPRNMELFKGMWTKYENQGPKWRFSAAEMEEDMFRHRIGAYPTLEMILKSIPVLREDKIPQDGVRKFGAGQSAFLEDTDAILMERNGQIIFQELFPFCTIGFPLSRRRNSVIVGDIRAKWHPQERRGEFVVRIYFNQKISDSANVPPLLGAWFGVSPLPLSKLVGHNMIANADIIVAGCPEMPAPPFNLSETIAKESFESLRDEMISAVEVFNEEVVSASTDLLSLQSSLGNSSRLGGLCLTDSNFAGMLKRFFTEMLPEDVCSKISKQQSSTWTSRALGITSHHRSMRQSQTRNFLQPGTYWSPNESPDVSVASYVRHEDLALCQNIYSDCHQIVHQTQSMKGLLLHLENLGHTDSPFVEGLNVELLPFQRQTLQWALERETTPGGLQSYFWARLPFVEDQKCRDVYFCPILNGVTTTKPKLVRGGIIADEMGLGKTVVSLGLVLQNPAPLQPESGTKSNQLKAIASQNIPGGVGWNPVCDTGDNSVLTLSRGTLVICHVSLVGQWIEEAKSKLSNPGLVYAYHGQNRKRDAWTLAKNSIVVTTYATLASDKFHKGYHQDRTDYRAPCEQVRWWRIICDESHTLKSDSRQRKAVLSIVGDHRWAVSGTPWNTSLNDVKGQLQFVGIEHIDEIFERVCNKNTTQFGPFTFLMRAVMIRHSQKQQYRGTSTTLMSLPPKTERSIEITFKGMDAVEYAKLEKESLDFYLPFRATHRKNLSCHYLKLIQSLTPLRIACAGGRIPLIEDGDVDENEAKVSPNAPAIDPKKQKKDTKFSDFVFQTKSIALIEELKRIRDEDPTSKSLIFSQYASSLKFLQEELPRHGFQFRTLSGDMTLKKRAEALSKFQKDPPTTIFLLSMRAGAVGINLTQANRVFMLEPAMNPALEAQAIGRVYRLGQTRPVEIIRLIMKDSVETRMLKFLEKKYGMTQNPTAKEASKVDDAATSAAVASNAIVGSLRTDRAAIMADEFDILFGVDSNDTIRHEAGSISHEEGSITLPMDFVPDHVGSDHPSSGCI